MSNKSLVEQLKFWRAERPDEWTMDEFIRDAEKLEQDRNELAAQVERLHDALSLQLNDCINFDGAKLSDCILEHSAKVLTEQPPTALAALKAQWQAEAITEFMNTVGDSDYLWDFGDIKDFSIEYIKRLQEPNNANTNNPPA